MGTWGGSGCTARRHCVRSCRAAPAPSSPRHIPGSAAPRSGPRSAGPKWWPSTRPPNCPPKCLPMLRTLWATCCSVFRIASEYRWPLPRSDSGGAGRCRGWSRHWWRDSCRPRIRCSGCARALVVWAAVRAEIGGSPHWDWARWRIWRSGWGWWGAGASGLGRAALGLSPPPCPLLCPLSCLLPSRGSSPDPSGSSPAASPPHPSWDGCRSPACHSPPQSPRWWCSWGRFGAARWSARWSSVGPESSAGRDPTPECYQPCFDELLCNRAGGTVPQCSVARMCVFRTFEEPTRSWQLAAQPVSYRAARDRLTKLTGWSANRFGPAIYTLHPTPSTHTTIEADSSRDGQYRVLRTTTDSYLPDTAGHQSSNVAFESELLAICGFLRLLSHSAFCPLPTAHCPLPVALLGHKLPQPSMSRCWCVTRGWLPFPHSSTSLRWIHFLSEESLQRMVCFLSLFFFEFFG